MLNTNEKAFWEGVMTQSIAAMLSNPNLASLEKGFFIDELVVDAKRIADKALELRNNKIMRND